METCERLRQALLPADGHKQANKLRCQKGSWQKLRNEQS